MLEVYRLEDKDGNGLFFYKDGRIKNKSALGDWKSDDKELFSFVAPIRFTEPSYIEFLNDDNYVLYKLTLSDYIYKSKYGEVTFLKEHINNAIICNKQICKI